MNYEKKILVAVVDYPNKTGNIAMAFVHTRNLYYSKRKIHVTVLNFSAQYDYTIDGIDVITLDTYIKNREEYDILVIHSANIRNHYKFLKRYGNRFKKYIFFFHGHEIVKINSAYPPKYKYVKETCLKRVLQNIYDVFKLYIWKKFYPKICFKSEYIFVSECLYRDFLYYTGIDIKCLKGHVHIINNSIGEVFQDKKYKRKEHEQFDFITVRNNLDSSVYCIDLLCKLAINMPNKKFLLIGKGDWFKYNIQPNNLTWIDKSFKHDELVNYIDSAKTAIMLTRRDSQGVMSCEMASYGIPLITSDLLICHEMFDDFVNVKMIKNDITIEDIEKIYNAFDELYIEEKNTKFYNSNTVEKEVKIIKERG